MDDIATKPPKSASAFARVTRGRLRLLLLVVIPVIALAVGLSMFLSGGRYISTDNAYVGARKVLITPDISGKVSEVQVREGQHVAAGDALFEIDAAPLDFALRQAQGKVEGVRADFANLKSNYQSLSKLIALGDQAAELKRRDVARKTALAKNRTGTQLDLDNANESLLQVELQLQLARQQLSNVLNQLGNNPDLPIEEFPAYSQAKAALDQAQRDLDHTVIKAPISGIATQVDNVQLGRFVMAGTTVFAVIDDSAPWIDANPKETDITALRVAQKVSIKIDTFPGRIFHGSVASVSPGTGSQFAILPPQNANGNWVKVVQRVPVRIAFDSGQDVSLLRTGMSAVIEIDTGRHRSLAALLGIGSSAAKDAQP